MSDPVFSELEHVRAIWNRYSSPQTFTLQPADYAILTFLLTVSAVIGFYFMWLEKKQEKSQDVENYLLGGRKLHYIPVALSLTASFMSAITVLGTPAEFYLKGTMFIYSAVIYTSIAVLVAHFFIPVLYPLNRVRK